MGSTALPKTPADKRLSLKHLDTKIAVDRKHASDHVKASTGPGDTYNNAHAKDHKKSEKANLKQRSKVAKAKVKTAKKTG